VIASLIYAALQFRIYAKAAREVRYATTIADLQEFRKLLATDADRAHLSRRPRRHGETRLHRMGTQMAREREIAVRISIRRRPHVVHVSSVRQPNRARPGRIAEFCKCLRRPFRAVDP
jgi:hypothetical protein